MTLVVARLHKGITAVVSDTQLTEHGMMLPPQRGVIKTCLLPGDLCVSFSHSPELATKAFLQFTSNYPDGATFATSVAFFEASSAETDNEYILCFTSPMKIVKITGGKRMNSIASTAWIGDKAAYERFREYETRSRPFPQHGRAINSALFMDEMNGSPASDLYSTMRNVILDPEIPSVGGFAYTVSSRVNGFRQSVYCDILHDWPTDPAGSYQLDMNDPIDFGASGENLEYSIAQISPSYIGINLAGFYYIKARKLFFFYGERNGLPVHCRVYDNVTAPDVKRILTAELGVGLTWLVTVASSAQRPTQARNSPKAPSGPNGIGIGLFFHENSFSKETPNQ